MTQLTVRGVDQELHQKLKQQAIAGGLSVNKYVVQLLQQAVGIVKKQPVTKVYTDLDALAGTWSQEEFDEFEKSLEWTRQIDQELWE